MPGSAASPRQRWEKVMERLVTDRGDALLRYAYFVSGSHNDAADLVQDAVVKTFSRVRNGFTAAAAEAYVRRAILTTHIDQARRRQGWSRVFHLAAAPDAVDSSAGNSGDRIDLTAALGGLSPRERACLVLRYYDDLKVDDIAATLELSPGTVKRYLSDGLAKMAVSLGTADDERSPSPSLSATPSGDPRAH